MCQVDSDYNHPRQRRLPLMLQSAQDDAAKIPVGPLGLHPLHPTNRVSRFMFSPPPNDGRFTRPKPRPCSFLQRRARYLYVALALLTLYLWYSSPASLKRKPVHAPSLKYNSVDWSRYAYSSYATSSAYLCNSVMLFEALDRLGSKADRILFYDEGWDLNVSDERDRDSQLLLKASQEYNVKLVPAKFEKQGYNTWDASYGKFLAWQQTQYDRVIHIDSDITIRQHLDELFMLPKTSVAMTRAYWSLPSRKALTSMIVMLKPSYKEFTRLTEAGQAARTQGREFDMDILNNFYDDSATVLPHRKYGLISGEFRSDDHRYFLGHPNEEWDPQKALEEASLVHFSDWPVPKPWVMWPRNLLSEMQPKCKKPGDGKEDCTNKQTWLALYDDFRHRRKVVPQQTLIFGFQVADRCRMSVLCCQNRLPTGFRYLTRRRPSHAKPYSNA